MGRGTLEADLQDSSEGAANYSFERLIIAGLPPCTACWSLSMVYVLCALSLKTSQSATTNAEGIGFG